LSRVRLVDPLGERLLEPGDFPVALGGPGSTVVLPGCTPREVLAEIAMQDGRFVLAPRRGTTVRMDGRLLEGPTPLPEGSVADLGRALLWVESRDDGPALVVEHEAVANVTLPPLAEEAALVPGSAARIRIEPVDYRAPGARPLPRRREVAWGRLAVGAAALAVVAVLALLLLSVAVTVRTTPDLEPDRVDFVGTGLELPLAGRYLVLPGEYTLAVEAEGYAPAALAVTVARDEAQEFVVPLERLPGNVLFDTGGIEAVLSVDGNEAGPVPGEHALAPGIREILIEAPRHVAYRESLDVVGGGESQTVSVRLEPDFAQVTVESVPAGARVLLEEEEIGVTPLVRDIDAGRYTLALEHPDYRRYETPITVKAGEPLKVGPVELGLPDGTLAVRTEPEGADVSVSGRYRGRTPVTLPLAPGLSHEVVVSRPGYASQSRSIAVSAGERRTLSMTLEPVLGQVTVRGEPADAELFVDGRSRGPANQTVSLPAAPHAIEVRKPGLATFKATVTPKPELPQVVEYRLTSPEQARFAQLPPLVQNSVGAELRLVRGGTFTMGSPRREPGRRSNEAERRVELKRPFYIGVREVTNREFREFRANHASGIFKEESLDLDRQPVARVSWQDAAAFCNWLSGKEGLPPAYASRNGRLALAEPVTTGYRLPTEAEWEFVARHDGSEAIRKYPWGDALPVAPRSGNYADQSAIYLTPVVISGYDDGFRVAAPVGSFAPNPLGLFDLGGNVSEWTTDHYSIYVTGADAVATDPVGPSQGETWVIRGSSWLTGKTPDLRLAWRDVGAAGKPDLGFRIARYAE